MIHTTLIKLNGIRAKLMDELEDFENMRKGISENQRSKLEARIDSRKVMISELNIIELNIRDTL